MESIMEQTYKMYDKMGKVSLSDDNKRCYIFR